MTIAFRWPFIQGLALCSIIAVVGPAHSQICLSPPSGLAGWWPLEEASGIEVNGPVFVQGKVGRALSFDGTNDYLQLNNKPANPFPASGFTYEFWINPSDTPAGRSRTIVSNHHAFGNWWNGISLVSGKVELLLQNAAVGSFSWTTQSALAANAWSHVAVVYQHQGTQATDAIIYINGVPQAVNISGPSGSYASFVPGYNPSDNLGLAIGRLLEDIPGAYFKGLMDEVSFYNRSLSGSEIAAIYQADSSGKCKESCDQIPQGLVSLWSGEGHGLDLAVLEDGAANNGLLVGGIGFDQGIVGSAFNFDGLDDFIDLNNGLYGPFPASGFTYEFWINPSDTPAGRSRTIVSNHHAFGNWWNGISLVSGNVELVLQNAAVGSFSWTTQSALAANAWSHVAVVYQHQGNQATDAIIYINGVPQAVNTSSPSASYAVFAPGYDSADPLGLAIGRLLEDTPGAYFKGLIDEMGFHNRTLMEGEILDIFNFGSSVQCKIIVPVNNPPVANAGPDQTVEATGPAGASVTLNGLGSSDPDGDSLIYKWSGPFPDAEAPSPVVTVPLGTHSISLTVNDGKGGSATDSVVVTVRDTTPPEISASLSPIGHVHGKKGLFLIKFAARDLVDPQPTSAAVMAIPSGTEAFPVRVRRSSDKGRGSVVFDLRKGVIFVKGISPTFVAEAQAAGGFSVNDKQVVRLHLNVTHGDRAHGVAGSLQEAGAEQQDQWVYNFHGSVLTEVRAPEITLEARAQDASGNYSETRVSPDFAPKRLAGGRKKKD